MTALAELARGSEQHTPGQDAAALADRLARVPAAHPRLHFDAQGLRALSQRAGRTHRRHLQLLLDWVDRNRRWQLPELPDRSQEVVLEQSAAFLTNAALAYVLARRPEDLHLARRWMLAMCRRPKTQVRNYGLGIYAAGLARAYDWLYDELSPADRRRARDHIAKLAGQVYLGSFPGRPTSHWWAGAPLHHDHWVPVGGYGEAALALLGEVEEAPQWAARAKLDFDLCLSLLGDDGAWHEGAADWCYTLAPMLWFYGAWQTATGEDLHQSAWLRNTAAYRLYHWLPDDTYVYLNDSFRSGRYNTSGSASSHLLHRLASLFGDGHAQWLAARDETFDLKPGPKGVYQAPYEGSSYRAGRTEYPHTASQCVGWNVLWHDPAVPVKPPGELPPTELPPSRHFADTGVAILRTGWDRDAAVVSLACGPLGGHPFAQRIRAGGPASMSNVSHAHADYNAITLFARGEYFLIPAGYARRSSHFQNTVSVSGADFRPDPSLDVRIVGFCTGDGFSYAVGDARAAFPEELGVTRYRRHVVLLDDGWCVLFDDLQLADNAGRSWNRFQWNLHSDPRRHDVSIRGTTCSWGRPSDETAGLRMHVMEPEEFAWERAVLKDRAGTGMLEAVRLVRPEWYGREMRVLAAFEWQSHPTQPTVLRHKQFLGVLPDRDAACPAVGFALGPLSPAAAAGLNHEDLQGRKLLLFGTDPNQPGRHLTITDGNVR